MDMMRTICVDHAAIAGAALDVELKEESSLSAHCSARLQQQESSMQSEA
jgi:hypothetical protein